MLATSGSSEFFKIVVETNVFFEGGIFLHIKESAIFHLLLIFLFSLKSYLTLDMRPAS